MVNIPLTLKPEEMNKATMSRLEELGLIRRLAPGKDSAGPVENDNLGRSLYESDPVFGGHKLITATIDAPVLTYFGYHRDCEDVLLLGLDSYKPLYFVFALCFADAFKEKVAAGSLAERDLLCLRARYNDPEASFYTVNPMAPHGEFVLPGDGGPPSFYVTEPTELKIDLLSFGGFEVYAEIDGGRRLVSK